MASRRHYRYIVRDKYGYAVQNALVSIYQPDGTTVFSGSAYDAYTAGSTVTNPFTTNDQGEIEAWFDTPQRVDVLVTDNTNTAYRAVEGASATLDFTSFTEQDEIIGDVINVDVTPSDARTTASTGTDDDAARADHIHSFPAAAGKTSKQTKTTTTEEVLHSLSVPLNTLAAGSMFHIAVKGYQTNNTTIITFTFRVRFGDTTLTGTVIGQALALAGTTTIHTDNPVQLDFLMTVQSIGATGTATGSWSGSECITTAGANTPKLVLDVQNAAATIDTTETALLELTLELSATTGTPNFEVDNVLIEQVA